MLNNFAKNSLVLAAILFSPIASFAANGDNAKSVQVSFADLNLASESGRAALNARITQAADQICQKPVDRDIAARAQFRECRQQALASAQSQLQHAISAASRAGDLTVTLN